jgi:hypothetical protein
MEPSDDQHLANCARLLGRALEQCAREIEAGRGGNPVLGRDGKPTYLRLGKNSRPVTIREYTSSLVDANLADPIGRAMSRNHADKIRWATSNFRYVYREAKKIYCAIPMKYREACRPKLAQEFRRVFFPCQIMHDEETIDYGVILLGSVLDNERAPADAANHATYHALRSWNVTMNAIRNGAGSQAMKPDPGIVFLVKKMKREMDTAVAEKKQSTS